MMINKAFVKVACTLLVIGGINWGAIGVTSIIGSRFDAIEYITANLFGLGYENLLGNLIYVFIGIAAFACTPMCCKR